MLPWFAALMTTTGLLLAGLAVYVGRRRGSRAGVALAVLLAAVAWWGLAYALELTADDVAIKSRWGDLKYLGVCLLAPAWLVFVLQYTNRGERVTTRFLAALAVEPAIVMARPGRPRHPRPGALLPDRTPRGRTWSWSGPARCSGCTSSTRT